MANKDIFRPPSATAAELTANSGFVGEIVYNETTGKHQQWNGSAWVDVGGAAGDGHEIRSNGTPVAARAGLNFSPSFTVADDNGNDETDIGIAVSVATQHSLTGGGDLSATRTLSLVGDEATPAADHFYGTDGSGNRAWIPVASGSGLAPTEVTISGGAPTLTNNTLSVIVSTDGSGCTLPAIGAADKLLEVWTEGSPETIARGSTDTIQDGSATDFEIPPYHSAVFAAEASTADWHVTLRRRFNHTVPPLYTYTGGAMVLDFQGGSILRVLVTTNFSGQWPLPTGFPAAPDGAVLRGELHIEIDGSARSFTNATPWALWSSGSEWKAGDEIQGSAPYVDGTAGATTKVSFTSARVSGAWEHQLEGQILESETTMDCRTLADADYTFADGDNGIAYHMTPTAARTLYFPTSTKKGWRCQVAQIGTAGSITAALVSTGTLHSSGNAYTHAGGDSVVVYWCEKNDAGNAPHIWMAGQLTT